MKSNDARIAELERKVEQLTRESLRNPAREAAPLAPRHGRWLGHTADALNGDGSIDVTVWLYSVGDDEWQENATIVQNVRGFRGSVPPTDSDVYVFWYENTWCLLPAADSSTMVQIDDYGSHGDVIVPDMSIRPAFQAKIKSYDPDTNALIGDTYCWVLFVDDYENVLWDTACVNGEFYGPAKYVGLETFDFTEAPCYTVKRGDLVEMVQVYHSEGTPPSPGEVVEGNAAGYHDGRVVRYSGTSTLDSFAECWIQFTTPYNGLAIQSQYYGPAKYAGIYDLVTDPGEETESHDKRPVFIVDHGDHVFPGRFDAGIADGASGTFSVYHPTTLEDSGYNLTVYCHGDAIIEGKGFATFVGSQWFGANSECETSPPPE